MAYFPDLVLAVQVYQVNRELHKEGVDGLAGLNPQSFARSKPGVFEQAGPPLGARIGDIASFRQNGGACFISYQDLQF